jgi:hypothetical protein
LTSLSIKKCAAVTAEGAKAFANLVNLVNLDLERCPKIHGGLVHLKGILFSLSSSIMNYDQTATLFSANLEYVAAPATFVSLLSRQLNSCEPFGVPTCIMLIFACSKGEKTCIHL